MQATFTELQRGISRVARALAGGETVQLTKHGKTQAEIRPRARAMTGAEFRQVWQNRKRLDKSACDEGIAALKKLDAAL